MTSFGEPARRLFLLEPQTRFLNHGSFGAVPRVVAEAAAQRRGEMEANPDRFMREVLPGALRDAATALAACVRARGEDVVFVENATAGVSTVLRSLELRPGDEILTSDHCYGAVRQAIRYVCERTGAQLVEAAVPLPIASSEGIFASVAERLSARTRLLVIDHIASPTGIVFPAARLAGAARGVGARVLIDGAHAPGQIEIDVPAMGADWYVGNCHKWLFAPRGCGFLWARADSQAGLHPLSISHRYGQSLAEEFDWTGTRDFSPWLAMRQALAFFEGMGPESSRAYNHGLVAEASGRVAAAWQTQLDGPESLHANMLGIRVPARLHHGAAASKATSERLQAEWHAKHQMVVAINPHSGALWLRISAQIYNTPEDYRVLETL